MLDCFVDVFYRKKVQVNKISLANQLPYLNCRRYLTIFLNWNCYQVFSFLLDFFIGLYFLITGTHVPGVKVSPLFRTWLVWLSEPFSSHVPGIYNLTFFSVFRTFQQPYLLQAGPTNASREMESVATQPGTNSLNIFTIVVQHSALGVIAKIVIQVDRSR